MPKVIVGMSGGVDSSVTAYLLKKNGYDVEGLSFILWDAETLRSPKACCSLQAVKTVLRTSHYFGIKHNVIDVRNEFKEKVIDPFVKGYREGITPNPCVLCNKYIKFPFLLKEAKKRDTEFIATGHYARLEKSQRFNNDIILLKKGVDPKKDQSYVLYILKKETLKRLILPLGYCRKDDVRKIARELHLPSAERAESQEICFIEDKKYSQFIEKFTHIESKPSPIIDVNGKLIGTHKGIHGYTVGQRKGMGISSPEPVYVIKIDAKNNIIYAGSAKAAKRREFSVNTLNWIIEPSDNTFKASVKIRSTMKDKPASILFDKGRDVVRVIFDEPQWAPAPGQSAIFYQDDILMGGGVII